MRSVSIWDTADMKRSVESLCKALRGRKWWCSWTCDLNDLWWGNKRKAAEFLFLGHTEGFSLQRRLRFGGRSLSGSSCLCCWFIRHTERIILSSRSKSVAGVESSRVNDSYEPRKAASWAKADLWNKSMAEIFLVCEPERAKWHWITVSLEKSRWASCRWNSKSKDAARAGFDDCVAAWEASLFICFHLLDVSLSAGTDSTSPQCLWLRTAAAAAGWLSQVKDFSFCFYLSVLSAAFLYIFSLWTFQLTGRRCETSPWCLSSAPASFPSPESRQPTRRKVSSTKSPLSHRTGSNGVLLKTVKMSAVKKDYRFRLSISYSRKDNAEAAFCWSYQ